MSRESVEDFVDLLENHCSMFLFPELAFIYLFIYCFTYTG